MDVAAVVLAGGGGRRLGGADKPTLPVAGSPMLARVLAAVDGCDPRVVVGPGRLGAAIADRSVGLVSEEPAGGGPVAAVAAGLAVVPAESEVVAVLAADLPLLTAGAVGRLLGVLDRPAATGEADGTPSDVDGAVFVDGDGRRQLLCGVWRAAALRAALDRVRSARGRLAGASVRSLVEGLRVVEVSWTGGGAPPWFDCDTERDLARAEGWVRGGTG